MRFERVGACFAAAALALLSAPGPAPGADILWVPLCGGGHAPLPLSRDHDAPPGKPCPAACHAACLGERKNPGEAGPDEAADA